MVDYATDQIFTFDHNGINIWAENYDIETLFDIWLTGGDLWRNAKVETIVKAGINPFTKEPMEVSTVKRVRNDLFLSFAVR